MEIEFFRSLDAGDVLMVTATDRLALYSRYLPDEAGPPPPSPATAPFDERPDA